MRKCLIAAIILAVAGSAFLLLRNRPPQQPTLKGPTLSVRFLNEDYGNAIIMRAPEGNAIVLDPASRSVDDLIDLLKSESVREVGVVVTQPSYDAARAVGKLQRNLGVRAVALVAQGSASERWQDAFQRAARGPVQEELLKPAVVEKLSPSVRLVMLAPSPSLRSSDACVLRISYGDKSIFYISELDPKAESALIASVDGLQSSVLAIGKRARRDNPSLELLSRVRPEVCVLCSNRPQSGQISRLRTENSGATLLRTDKDGIIEIVTNGRTVQALAADRP